MNTTLLHIKQFRCFTDFVLSCNASTLIIIGDNGTGKTSILEALHYMCYLRSFRTYAPKELVQFDRDSFFIKLCVTDKEAVMNELQVGFSQKKRLVKINHTPVSSYKELIDCYRVVTVTEDDIELIKGSPEYRRTFIDQALFLVDETYIQLLKQYKHILENRNALLQHTYIDAEMYAVWTEQLFMVSQQIAHKRITWLAAIEKAVALLLQEYVDRDMTISIAYLSKLHAHAIPYDAFMAENKLLYEQEKRFKRTLFGVHLDDILFQFQGKKSRMYASRGQQKLIVLLIKIAHIQSMQSYKGSLLFLLDDFMTDFDDQRIMQLWTLLEQLDCQKIFTVPNKSSFVDHVLKTDKVQLLNLTNSNL